jgi:hypothetical protein
MSFNINAFKNRTLTVSMFWLCCYVFDGSDGNVKWASAKMCWAGKGRCFDEQNR